MDQQHNHQNLDDSYLLPSPNQSLNTIDNSVISANAHALNDTGLKQSIHQQHTQQQQQQQHHQQLQQPPHILPHLPNPQNIMVKTEQNFGFGPALHTNQQYPYKRIPSQTGVPYQPITQQYPQSQLQQSQQQQQQQPFQYDFTNQQQQKPPQYYLRSNTSQFNQPFQPTTSTQPQMIGSQIRPSITYSSIPAVAPMSTPLPSNLSQNQDQEGGIGSSSQISSNKRKRARKSDHAPQGDQGDTELKQLAFAAADTSLEELATRIKLLENDDSKDVNFSPNSGSDSHKYKETKERQRQIFGMVWLFNSCEASPTAVVPRNRIYARYVHICAENNLAPLSPASFGKLVRILFPNLTTRRLGMRGQSKYHYCGIKLNGDQNIQQHKHQHTHSISANFPGSSTGAQLIQSPASSSNSSVSFEDSPASISRTNSPSFTPINSPSVATSSLISDQIPSVAHLKYIPNLMESINNNLLNPNESIKLPSIYPYIPRDTDYDIADTLYSLYKVHVNSLFESLRFMQLKKFFACFSNFNSILTAPVIKLYTNDRVIEWIKLCDLAMYKKMIRMLTKLQNQYSIPTDLLSQLKHISSGYVKNMSNNLLNNKITKNLVVMKLKLAKNFINLLNRLIKNIETGQATVRILNDVTEKQSMLQDWSRLDIPEIVNREIPCTEQNLEVLIKVLNEDIFMLLGEDSNERPNQGIMVRVCNYLAQLPGRFTGTNPRFFILLASNLLTTCLREISLTGGQGFGAWWIVRCWVDEFLAWNFELGGFLQDDFTHSDKQHKSVPTNDDSNQQHFQATHAEGNHDRANSSFGAVDLLDISYGLDKSNDTGTGNFASAVAAATNDILLNYESSVDNILG